MEIPHLDCFTIYAKTMYVSIRNPFKYELNERYRMIGTGSGTQNPFDNGPGTGSVPESGTPNSL